MPRRFTVTLGIRELWYAWTQGIRDGWEQPWDLTSGLTWEARCYNEVYDRGANLGQFWGRWFRSACAD